MESRLAGVDSSPAAEPVFSLEAGGAGVACATAWPMSLGCMLSSSASNTADTTAACAIHLSMCTSVWTEMLQNMTRTIVKAGSTMHWHCEDEGH